MQGENVNLVFGLLLFVLAGAAMILVALGLGRWVRPRLPHPEKDEPYECGEPTIGTSWVQFDLRFYVVALVFVIFDIEIALFYPWAVVFKQAGAAGLWGMVFFFGIIVVGFLYLLKFGYLDWVRATTGEPPERNVRPDDPLGKAAGRWSWAGWRATAAGYDAANYGVSGRVDRVRCSLRDREKVASEMRGLWPAIYANAAMERPLLPSMRTKEVVRIC